uniref:Uncharacterized protein n=1 Tax=Sphaerodactylus townsendi TaxID=933632 RepID=A0ACB8GBL7_9SAUR
MGLVRLWAVLALFFLPLAFCGGAGVEEPAQTEVLRPTNVEIKTYNFKTTLHWDYPDISPEPVFTVQIQCYNRGNYMDVRSCVNISQHYCDITHEINYECDPSWAKVKAFAGSRQSEYEDSKKFHPFRDAQIGPSKFNLSVVSDEIKVFIEHPLTPYEGKYPLSVKANLTDFSYSILLWKQASPHKDQSCHFRDDIYTRQHSVKTHQVSIVRSIKPANSFETRTEGKYTAISSLNCYPAREDEKPEEPIEHLTEVETSDLEVSGKTAVESQTIQEASAGESCENELSHEDSDSYFKSVSDQEKICDSLPNEGVPRADVQQSTDLGACRKMSGYDKPHWMIPDTGGCEPPIA